MCWVKFLLVVFLHSTAATGNWRQLSSQRCFFVSTVGFQKAVDALDYCKSLETDFVKVSLAYDISVQDLQELESYLSDSRNYWLGYTVTGLQLESNFIQCINIVFNSFKMRSVSFY